MARLILSAGMFSALAAAIAVLRRGFVSGSPPLLAAIAISLMRRVKILPRLASSAPFLCLIVAHLEWPDIGIPRSMDVELRFDDEVARGGNHWIASTKLVRRTEIIACCAPFQNFALPPVFHGIFRLPFHPLTVLMAEGMRSHDFYVALRASFEAATVDLGYGARVRR